MAKVYLEKDANLDFIKGKRISFVGYGNQGRSQALNMRESGFDVIIGNIEDDYLTRARDDKFDVYSIKEATREGDVIMLLLPDEIAPGVYYRDIHGELEKGNVLCFASGYNITYDYISPPEFIDLILVAPRMGGGDVRARYVNKEGFVSLIGAEQDYSGEALKRAIAISMAIGSTQGALMSTFEEETIVDLFGEQLQGMSLYTTQLAYEMLIEAGCSPEASLLELYMSEEVSDDWRNIARIGIWKQLRGHSTTSQYGQLTRGELAIGEEARELFKKTMDDIKSGKFAREWMTEQKTGHTVFKRLMKRNQCHPINDAEEEVFKILKKNKD